MSDRFTQVDLSAEYVDFGVTRLDRKPGEARVLTRVQGRPVAGQYAFDGETGAYTLSAEEVGRKFRFECVHRDDLVHGRIVHRP